MINFSLVDSQLNLSGSHGINQDTLMKMQACQQAIEELNESKEHASCTN